MSQRKFAVVINCIDGRVQLPVLDYLKREYGVDYVDNITEAAPVKILAERKTEEQLESIRARLKISTEKHGSEHLGIVAHHDCAGNPVDKETQLSQLRKSMETIRAWGFKGAVIGLWVDENWCVHAVKE
ncbi:MAG: carbonic anhydrase [Candidatus Bathyarchaeales archaeon]